MLYFWISALQITEKKILLGALFHFISLEEGLDEIHIWTRKIAKEFSMWRCKGYGREKE